jgi:two-component system chemotaxis response regulator CheY
MSQTILIADDSASMRAVLAMTLREKQYVVVEAKDGKDALAKLPQQKVSLIVSDLNMPGMNGIELIRAVKALPGYKFLPIVMLTTEGHAEKKEEGRQAGVTAWIVKPFNPDVLNSVVKRILG